MIIVIAMIITNFIMVGEAALFMVDLTLKNS
jgi:hypothetical protein